MRVLQLLIDDHDVVKGLESMLEIKIDQEEVKRLLYERLDFAIRKAEKEITFWDMRELERQTSMSANTMKDNFFYEEGFPKYKIGGKWYFPAVETRKWLLEWLKTKGGIQ